MSFKNAVKILLSRFGLVWALLIYIFAFCVVIAGLSVGFIMPVFRAFKEAGIMTQIGDLFGRLLSGLSLSELFVGIKQIGTSVAGLFREQPSTLFDSTLFFVLILVLADRFFVGLYEIPLTDVLDGQLSANAHFGFFGRFVGRLGTSARFVLCKMVYTILFDAAGVLIFYGLFSLMDNQVMYVLAPFLIMLVFILLYSFRFALVSMWAPAVANGKPIIKAFAFSVRRVFRNFGAVYSSFIVSWIVIVAVNLLVGIFTFGAGLLVTLPLSMLFVSCLNMTVYYGKNNRRYYVDGSVVTPPMKK